MEVAKNYKNGNKTNSNLTQTERDGKRKLQERIKRGEIVIAATDKSGKIGVSNPDTYLGALMEHTKEDMEVGWKEVEEVEKLINRHARMFRRIVGLGELHPGKETRLAGALTGKDTGPPPLYIQWKDHKKDFLQRKQTRPVCNGNVGPLTRLSEILSRTLRGVLEGVDPGACCSSTEELVRSIREANCKMDGDVSKKNVVFSMDVKALYPSININDATRCIEDLIMKSTFNIEINDLNELRKYLAIVLTMERINLEGLKEYLPKRYNEVSSNRKKPGIAFLDTEVIKSKGIEVEKWIWEGVHEPSENVIKRMIALMMGNLIEAVMDNYLYGAG